MTDEERWQQPLVTTDEESWQVFLCEYVETGFFDVQDRPKTLNAMRTCFERIPQTVWDEMPSVTIFAPAPCILGHMLQAAPGKLGEPFIYLSPALENLPQEEVDFTVAHEFAHAVKGHYLPGNTASLVPVQCLNGPPFQTPSETAADTLAESWGFKHAA
jgi:hypothetical protein